MGRPTKLTPELRADLCRQIEAGATQIDAAAYAGIHRATFQRWKAAGRKARSGQFRDFYDALKRAEAGFRMTHLQRIANSDPEVETRTRERDGKVLETIKITRPPDWRRSAWLLERRYPEEFRGQRSTNWSVKARFHPRKSVVIGDFGKRPSTDGWRTPLAKRMTVEKATP